MIRDMVLKKKRRRLSPAGQQGQALLELVFILPILLIIFIGMAEVGAAFYSYQIVVNAAREGARYGAKSLHIPDGNIASWARQSAGGLPITVDVDGTPTLDGEKATIIVTRLRKINSEGEYSYEVVETPHVEGGDGSSILTDGWFATQAEKSDQLVWPSGVPNQAMDLIAVEVMYNHPHLTGFFDFGEVGPFNFSNIIPNPIPLHSLTVMRVGGSRIPSCDAYPIAVHEDALEGLDSGDRLDGGIFDGTAGSGQFGWMRWSQSQANDADYLAQMLRDPRTSRRDFDNATDPDDHWLNTGDNVHGNTGISGGSAVRGALDALIGQRIRVPVWEYFHDGSGLADPDYYHISGFIWIELLSFDLSGKTMSAVFHGWDDTCTGAE